MELAQNAQPDSCTLVASHPPGMSTASGKAKLPAWKQPCPVAAAVTDFTVCDLYDLSRNTASLSSVGRLPFCMQVLHGQAVLAV